MSASLKHSSELSVLRCYVIDRAPHTIKVLFCRLVSSSLTWQSTVSDSSCSSERWTRSNSALETGSGNKSSSGGGSTETMKLPLSVFNSNRTWPRHMGHKESRGGRLEMKLKKYISKVCDRNRVSYTCPQLRIANCKRTDKKSHQAGGHRHDCLPWIIILTVRQN